MVKGLVHLRVVLESQTIGNNPFTIKNKCVIMQVGIRGTFTEDPRISESD